MGTTGWIILVVANIPLYVLLGRVFFKDWTDFFTCLEFWVTPDLTSAFRGEYWDDRWGTWKLAFWLGSCVASVLVEAALIQRIFG